jgi:hypothetical protein
MTSAMKPHDCVRNTTASVDARRLTSPPKKSAAP